MNQKPRCFFTYHKNLTKIFGLVCFYFLWILIQLPFTAFGADELAIIRQPQNPNYPEYSVAVYSVQAYGSNLSCTWFLNYNGKDYNISNNLGSLQPWEPYAGENYGPSVEINKDKYVTFTYFFSGIGSELSGSYIYATISDGKQTITSDKAYLYIASDIAMPPQITVVPEMTVYKDTPLSLCCQASSPDGSSLSYQWYETHSGRLQDILAINRGSETTDTLTCDTTKTGKRYYVCYVQTENGGSAHSSVIAVTILDKPAATSESLTDSQTEPKTSRSTEPLTKDTSEPLTKATSEASESLTKDATESSESLTIATTECDSHSSNEETAGQDINAIPTTYNDNSTTTPEELFVDGFSDKPATGPASKGSASLPWWGILLIALISCSIGAGSVLVITTLKKKSNEKAKPTPDANNED